MPDEKKKRKKERAFMEETKSMRRARLKHEERWEAFEERRKLFLGKTNKLGTRLYSAETAYRLAAKEFLAKDHVAEENEKIIFASKATFEGKKKASAREVAQWVAESLCIEGVRPSEAPSAVAWNMLQAYRATLADDPTAFFKQIYSKLMPTRAEIDLESRMHDDGRTCDRGAETARKVRVQICGSGSAFGGGQSGVA